MVVSGTLLKNKGKVSDPLEKCGVGWVVLEEE